MRTLFLAATLASFGFTGALSAESNELTTPEAVEELQLDQEYNIEERQQRQEWNRWVCVARAPGYFRPFVGRSYYFQAGSGEGQEARSIAHLNALRACQFRSRQRCQSRLESDCQVQRYN